MSPNRKVTPKLDQQNFDALNLTVLQRIDHFVEEILSTSSHVAVYEFDIDANKWSRKDVEGTLFVVKRNAQPRFQFIVMNRRNTDNLVEDLMGDFEYEVQGPYIMYRNAANEINGIWFYYQRDCEEVQDLIRRITGAFAKVHSKFGSATSEFEELEAVPSSDVSEGPLGPPTVEAFPSSDATKGPLEQLTLSSTTSVPDIPDSSVMKLISEAMNNRNVPNTTNGQPLQPTYTVPLSFHTPSVIPSTVPPLQSATAFPTSPDPITSILGTQDSDCCGTNLVKPPFCSPSHLLSSSVRPLFAPSVPTAPPLHPPSTMQNPYGAPLLQHFPPPNPTPEGPVITREKVRDALLRLVQNNQFVDMVYRELLNAHCL